MRTNEVLEEKNISKNAACKAFDIPRSNLNKHCRDEFQGMNANLICKLCEHFDCGVEDLIEYIKD